MDDSAGFDADDGRNGRRDRGRLAGVGRRVGRIFEGKPFLLALVAVTGGMLLGGSVPLIGAAGRFAGIFAVAFALGLAWSRRRYLEVGLAGALAAGLGFLLGVLTSLFPVGVAVLGDHGVAVAGVGAGTGALTALAGYYFGRDLRAGMTRDVS